MYKHLGIGLTILVSTLAILLTLASFIAGLAIQWPMVNDNDRIIGLADPVGVPLSLNNRARAFITEGCRSTEDMIRLLQADRTAVPGKLVMLADGLQQSFSNVWRDKAHAAPVRVSSIVALLFSNAPGDQWNAEVVEFDGDGCVISRTLMPGNVWNALLKAAVGFQI